MVPEYQLGYYSTIILYFYTAMKKMFEFTLLKLYALCKKAGQAVLATFHAVGVCH